jgi:hypothetical protein
MEGVVLAKTIYEKMEELEMKLSAQYENELNDLGESQSQNRHRGEPR